MSEKEMKEWLETPVYPDTNNERILGKHLVGFILGVALLCPVFMFVHEAGHAIVGTFFKWEVIEFAFGYDVGHVRFEDNPILQAQYFPSVLITVAGGVSISVFIWLLSQMCKPFMALIWAYLPYGLWEGIRGALVVLEAPASLYYEYMGFLPLIENIGLVIMVTLVVYQSYKILYQKPLGSME